MLRLHCHQKHQMNSFRQWFQILSTNGYIKIQLKVMSAHVQCALCKRCMVCTRRGSEGILNLKPSQIPSSAKVQACLISLLESLWENWWSPLQTVLITRYLLFSISRSLRIQFFLQSTTSIIEMFVGRCSRQNELSIIWIRRTAETNFTRTNHLW